MACKVSVKIFQKKNFVVLISKPSTRFCACFLFLTHCTIYKIELLCFEKAYTYILYIRQRISYRYFSSRFDEIRPSLRTIVFSLCTISLLPPSPRYIYIHFTGSIRSSYEYYVELRNPTIEVEHHQSLVWNLFAKSNASVLVHHWWLMEWWMAWSVFAWIQYGRHKFEILLLFV